METQQDERQLTQQELEDRAHWQILRNIPLSTILTQLGGVCTRGGLDRSTWTLGERTIVIDSEKKFVDIDDPNFAGVGSLDFLLFLRLYCAIVACRVARRSLALRHTNKPLRIFVVDSDAGFS